MISVNKSTLIGYVGRDPEVRNLPKTMKARFSVATTRKWKDKQTGEWQEQTEWHNVEAWGYLAERVERDLKKGSPVYVEGPTETQTWNDKEGNERSQKVIKAAQLSLLGERPPARQQAPTESHQDQGTDDW